MFSIYRGQKWSLYQVYDFWSWFSCCFSVVGAVCTFSPSFTFDRLYLWISSVWHPVLSDFIPARAKKNRTPAAYQVPCRCRLTRPPRPESPRCARPQAPDACRAPSSLAWLYHIVVATSSVGEADVAGGDGMGTAWDSGHGLFPFICTWTFCLNSFFEVRFT